MEWFGWSRTDFPIGEATGNGEFSETLLLKNKWSGEVAALTCQNFSVNDYNTNGGINDMQNSRMLLSREMYYLYLFMINNDGLAPCTSNAGSLEGLYIMLPDVTPYESTPGEGIRRLWFTPPGIPSWSLMDEVCVEINTGATEGFPIEEEWKKVLIILHVVGNVGDWAVQSEMSDL